MSQTTRRITGTINTIPAMTSISGAVTQSGADTNLVIYTGSGNWFAIFNMPATPPTLTPNPIAITPTEHQDLQSKIWVYITGATPLLARVIGITQIDATTWQLKLNKAATGIGAANLNYIVANLLGYTWLNDGGATGKINGVNVLDGENGGEPQLAPSNNRALFQDAILVDATSTDFLIQENR